MKRTLWVFWLVLAGCKCDSVKAIKPVVMWSPAAIDFGSAKIGEGSTSQLALSAGTRAAVSISNLRLESDDASAFHLKTDPLTISGNTTQNLAISFVPTEARDYASVLVFTTNDADHLTVRIPLYGKGATPIIRVEPECSPSRDCSGVVLVEQSAIDFGFEPLMRAIPLPASRLPVVNITNESTVPLVVSKIALIGVDATAFSFVGTVKTPITLEAMKGVSIPLRFVPTSAGQDYYDGILEIESDDVSKPKLGVALEGRLATNLSPQACANLIEVRPTHGCSPKDYRGEWPLLLKVPMNGYDFRSNREIEPGATVVFSAQSNSADPSTCTFDAEQGRQNLTYQWTVMKVPTGSPPFSPGSDVNYTISPSVPGDYELQLSVSDSQGGKTLVPMFFTVTRREDLIARLEWGGFSGVDLDLHLVRPSSSVSNDHWSGMFSFFNEGASKKVSGDLNGYSNKKLGTWGTGLSFEWGDVGTCDDPQLNSDDQGSGNLVEDLSLNHPERDSACDGGRCTYKLFVHYFGDFRSGTFAGCTVDGTPNCSDGERCSCVEGQTCVLAPPADGGRQGAGECRPAPKPTVKVFLRGSSTQQATIPLPPAETFMGTPCAALHVADVIWPSAQDTGSLPDGGTPLATVVERIDAGFARFGKRQPGDVSQCAPDDTIRTWYTLQP